jgi:hypothetical protein
MEYVEGRTLQDVLDAGRIAFGGTSYGVSRDS